MALLGSGHEASEKFFESGFGYIRPFIRLMATQLIFKRILENHKNQKPRFKLQWVHTYVRKKLEEKSSKETSKNALSVHFAPGGKVILKHMDKSPLPVDDPFPPIAEAIQFRLK